VPRTPLQALCFLLGLAIALWLSPFGSHAEPDRSALALIERRIYERVETLRAERALRPEERSEALDRVARAHSLDMAQRGYLAHETPEGLNPVGRIEAGGVSGFRLAAENIGQSSAADPAAAIVAGWLASPSHRENLFSPPWNATGVGAAIARDGSLIVTQVFVSFPRATH
jgi:uncharacterized protein YkwD